MKVKHKSYGEGIVKSINGNIIEISFEDEIKKFQFPKSFDMFLTTQDPELKEKIDVARKNLALQEKRVESDIARIPQTQPKFSYVPHPDSYKSCFTRSFSSDCSLVGGKAQTISFSSKEELFETIGYLTTPGRVSSFEAEVPKDGRHETFERLFPGQKYRPIETGDTPSGLPNKLGSQFRINFSNLRNCPEILKKNIGKGNGSCIGRINKSKFVLDMVQNYGFQFGEWQDREAIRNIAVKQGYVEAFDRGYSR